jgi:ATP-binding cassette subfamily C (CFTR/MRP) protein 4
MSDRHEVRRILGPILYSVLVSCDGTTAVFLFVVLQMGLSLLGAVTVVASVNIWLLLPAVIMFSVFYLLRVYFVATSRSIKRLEGISKLTYQT